MQYVKIDQKVHGKHIVIFLGIFFNKKKTNRGVNSTISPRTRRQGGAHSNEPSGMQKGLRERNRPG